MKRVRWIYGLVGVIVLGVSALYGRRESMVETATSTTVITREDIDRLSVGRNLSQILQTLPGVTAYQDQVSINGASPYDTDYCIDGLNMTNVMQQNQFMQLPLEAIQEIQVLQGPSGAQYGAAKGAVINVVTKSGGNEFHGSGFAYTSPDFLGGDLKNTYDSDPPHYRSMFDAGFTLGGPIIKDKLWFFGSFNHQILRTQPKYDDDPVKEYQNSYPFLKLSYKHDENDRIDFWYGYNRWGYDQGGMNDYNDWSSQTWIPRHGLGTSWSHGFGNGWQLDFGASYASSGYQYDSSSFHSSETGSNRYSSAKEKSSSRFRARADLWMPPFDCLCGEHEVGGGFEYGSDCMTRDWSSMSENQHSYMSQDYQYLESWTSYQNEQDWMRTNQFSVYLLDQVKISDNFTFNIGTRWDHASMFWPARNLDGKETEKTSATTWDLISPRVSMTYDITKDGRNVVKASAARYLQMPQYYWYTGANPQGEWGYDRNVFEENGVVKWDETNPYFIDPWLDVKMYDPDFDSPVLTEFTMAFEKALSDDVSVAVRGFYKRESRLVAVADGSRIDMDMLLDDGEIVWTGYQEVQVTNPLDGSDLTVYKDLDPGRMSQYYLVNSPDARREYAALQFLMSKKLSGGWMLDASFTYADWKGHYEPWDFSQHYGQWNYYQDPNVHINAEGPFMYQSPWAIKVTGMYQLPWGIDVTGFFQCYGGHPYTQQLSYNQPPLSDVFSGSVNGHDRAVNAQPKGSERLPTFWMLNLGLEKTFQVSDTVTATLFVDGYNITNNTTTLKVNPLIGSAQGDIERILNPGLFQFGVRVSF